MPQVINAEWLNQNSLRAYPIREDCLRMPVDDIGTVIRDIQLPNNILVDFVLTVAGSSNVRVYLKQVAYVGNLLSLSFCDQSDVLITSVSIDLNTHVKNTQYSITGTTNYFDARGAVVIGDLSNLAEQLAEGLYTFTLVTAELEARTVRPDLRGVRALQVVSDNVSSDYITGIVKLVAGTNVRLTYIAGSNAIRIDGVQGAGTGLNEECDCAEPIGSDNIVKTINGIPIEDVVIVGDGECVDVTTSGNKIVISDSCSTPCCDCPELEYITQSLKILEITVANLESYAQQIDQRVTAFVNNYILTIAAV